MKSVEVQKRFLTKSRRAQAVPAGVSVLDACMYQQMTWYSEELNKFSLFAGLQGIFGAVFKDVTVFSVHNDGSAKHTFFFPRESLCGELIRYLYLHLRSVILPKHTHSKCKRILFIVTTIFCKNYFAQPIKYYAQDLSSILARPQL